MGTPNTNPCGSIPHGDQIFFCQTLVTRREKTLFSRKNGVRFLTRALYTVPFNDLILTEEYLRGLKRSCFLVVIGAFLVILFCA